MLLFYDNQASIKETTLQNTPNANPVSHNLVEVATKFLASLPSDKKSEAQQEVYKFVRWYGEKRQINELTALEVANYAEQITSSTTELAEKLGVTKAFLTYAYKGGLTKTKLATHLKVKKTSAKRSSISNKHTQDEVLLTAQGYANLEAELATLIKERPIIIEEIRKAAADKDFRENAPLDAAKDRQGQMEARIRKLESTLKTAKLMDEKQVIGHKVTIGDTVVLRDLATSEQVDYTLVDASEANPIEGKISNVSPIGQALLGRKNGDKVEVKAPAGTIHYQIEGVKHY